jgi:hypothetical protein
MTNEISDPLTSKESSEWKKHRKIIEQHREAIWEWCESIRIIRDNRLYREDYKTFESFVDSECGIDKSYVNRMLVASETKSHLVPIGTKNARVEEINTEGQLRELRDVPAKEMKAVIKKAVEIAGDERITAKVLKKAVKQVCDPIEYEDTDDEPITERQPGEDDEEPPEDCRVLKTPAKTEKPELTLDERVKFLKKSIIDYNAYMIRAVDDLQTIRPNNKSHETVLDYFRLTHFLIEAWK